jgi:DNA-binding XRE family transcriptional regulator
MGDIMDKNEFCYYRRKLGKTQKELASILGMSLKTVHSYEQGWRAIPPHIARYLYFLIGNQRYDGKLLTPCWEKKLCAEKENCPAWEFQCGHVCWLVCGTLCESCNNGQTDKLDLCKKCDVFKKLFSET